MSQSNAADLPVFLKWFDFLKWLLVTTERFPKKVRFTFSDRMNELGLAIVESLVEARYSKDKKAILRKINLDLEKLRVLIRLSYELKFLSTPGYEQATKSLQEVGRMVGGWMKQNQTNFQGSSHEARAEFI